MALKGKPVAIGNTATTIYTCPASKEAAVHGLLFGNNTASALAVDVVIYNQAAGSDVTVVTDLAVPANGIATWSKPINLNAGDAVKAVSSAASGMVCLYSTYEDGATPVASGFTARGAWSSAATYVANDIVSVSGTGTYVAIQGSTNQDPTTATAYWMFLEGISASALPAQSGNAGKYLATDGTTASWADLVIPAGSTTYSSQSTDITLVATDDLIHEITFSSGGKSVFLPDATTLGETVVYYLVNKGDIGFAVKNDSGTVLSSVSPNQAAIVFLNNNTTSDGSWSFILGGMQGEFALSSEIYVTDATSKDTGGIAKISDSKVLTYWSDIDNSKFWFKAYDLTTSTFGTAVSLTVDFTDVADSTERVYYGNAEWLQDDSVAFVYHEYTGSSHYNNIKGVALSFSGTTITLGSPINLDGGSYTYSNPWMTTMQRIDNTRFVVSWSHYTSTAWDNRVAVASVSGTSMSVGAYGEGHNSNYPTNTCCAQGTSYIHAFDSSGSSSYMYYAKRWDLSGTNITNSSAYYTDNDLSTINSTFFLEQFGTDNKQAGIGYTSVGDVKFGILENDGNNQYKWTILQSVPNTSGTNDVDIRYLGLSGTTYSFGVFTGIAAGLSGAGTSFRKITWDSSTNVVSYGSATFLVGNFGAMYNRANQNKTGPRQLVVLNNGSKILGTLRNTAGEIKLIEISVAG